MSAKSPDCWASDPNARAVRIEISANESLLLPLDQFAFAVLKGEGKQQQLRLVFATHEVFLRGHALRRVETALQRMELSNVSILPERFAPGVADNQPTIREIVIKELGTNPDASGANPE